MESRPSGTSASATPQTKDPVASAAVEPKVKVEAGLVTKDGMYATIQCGMWHGESHYLKSQFYPAIFKVPNLTEAKTLLGYTANKQSW